MTTTTLSDNGRKISVQDATIRTATVEIKTLTISNKQVTLAVFRQLQEETLVDEDADGFLGLPWGTVNYHPDTACKDAGRHLHVIWQKGEELRRAFVSHSPPGENDMRQEKHREGKRFDNAVEWWWITSILDNHYRQPVQREDGTWVMWWNNDEAPGGAVCVPRAPRDFDFSLRAYLQLDMDEERKPRANMLANESPPYRYRAETPEEVSARISKGKHSLLPGMHNRRALLETTLELIPEARSNAISVVAGCLRGKRLAETEYTNYLAAYERRWADLQALGQLFIAV